jgi:hypothetical protein
VKCRRTKSGFKLGLADDEVMTTGFPPYQYEKYSENLFRSVWPRQLEWPRKLEMRVNYR